MMGSAILEDLNDVGLPTGGKGKKGVGLNLLAGGADDLDMEEGSAIGDDDADTDAGEDLERLASDAQARRRSSGGKAVPPRVSILDPQAAGEVDVAMDPEEEELSDEDDDAVQLRKDKVDVDGEVNEEEDKGKKGEDDEDETGSTVDGVGEFRSSRISGAFVYRSLI